MQLGLQILKNKKCNGGALWVWFPATELKDNSVMMQNIESRGKVILKICLEEYIFFTFIIFSILIVLYIYICMDTGYREISWQYIGWNYALYFPFETKCGTLHLHVCTFTCLVILIMGLSPNDINKKPKVKPYILYSRSTDILNMFRSDDDPSVNNIAIRYYDN